MTAEVLSYIICMALTILSGMPYALRIVCFCLPSQNFLAFN